VSIDLQEVYSQALAAHENGNLEQAVKLYATILAVHPDADLVLYNQGLALFALSLFDEAAAAFSRITEITTADADTWFNLGLALKECGKFSEAIKAYQQSLALQPDEDTLFNLANCCREGGAVDKAFSWYADLLKINPKHSSALNNYAYLAHREGNYSLAKKLYQQLLQLKPDHLSASHMLAALTGTADSTPAKSYIRDLFDQYSNCFEESLVKKLSYRVPELLFCCLQDHFSETLFERAVDLGCGTGLAGVLFKPVCTRLAGVDLSSEMIKTATGKKVYDSLAVSDVVEFLTDYDHNLDLLIAADLVTYLADLQPLFSAIADAAKSKAVFVFSTEHSSAEKWQVRPTGRFAHGRDYIAATLRAVGGRILSVKKENIRKEGRLWVKGDVYLAVISSVMSSLK
jgi:predicted TPR repeat methyltransferase